MRILAIRGKNIASLAGTFDVDFRCEPLASAGLFAICGPTGSGKSTLLDALCLALYDNTPRLNRATGRGALPDVRDETITTQDPRNLLRRGAAEGYAEVDFVGNDHAEYRARWSVRRARGRADGKLQAQDMRLIGLSDGQPAAGSLKSEVLEAIESRLGLGFEQFIRAVLLAQNEFTAFLHADDNARAELLELLTGTDTFTILSIRAYERSKAEQQTLDDLTRRAADQQPLEAEARAAIELGAREARATADTRAGERDRLDSQLRWHAERDAALELEGQARTALEGALRAVQEIEPRRLHLARVRSAQPARALLADLDRTTRDVGDSQDRAVPRAAQAADDARLRLDDAEARLTTSREALAAAAEQQRLAALDIERARELDRTIENLSTRHVLAASELEAAEAADLLARQAQAATQHDRDACAREQWQARQWCDAHAERQTLAEQWPRWDTLLTQARQAHEDSTTYRASLDSAIERIAVQREALEAAARARVAADTGAIATQLALDDAEQALAAFDLPGIVAERHRAQTRRDALVAARHADERLGHLTRQQRSLQDSWGAESARSAAADLAAGAIASRLALAEAARAQAEHSHEEMKHASAASVEKLRAALEPDRPCPVCGSVDHPYTVGDHGFAEALGVLKRQLKQRRAEVDTLTRQHEEQRATSSQALARAEVARADIARLNGELSAAEAEWHVTAVAAAATDTRVDERGPWFEAQLREAGESLRILDSRHVAAQAATQARDTRRRQRDVAHEQLRLADRAEADARLALETGDTSAAALRTALQRSDAQCHAVLSGLDAVIGVPDWRRAWRTDPAAFHHSQEDRAAEYETFSQALQASTLRIERLDISMGTLLETARRAAETVRRAQQTTDTAARDLSAARDVRLSLIGGRTVTDAVRAHHDAVQAARARTDECEHLAGQAQSTHAEAAARQDEARRLLAVHERAASDARSAMQSWLADDHEARPTATALDVPALRGLLAHDAGWIEREQDTVQALDAALSHARSVLDERRGRREAIDRARTSDDAVETLRVRRNQVSAEFEAAQRQRVELDAQLRQDDDRRQRGADLTAAIDMQRRQAVLWAGMSDLIGSADGKRFRNYAQQFTLDILLAFANRHLEDLSRRYRLERLKDRLALIIIDQDMGDDVRSIHSLSGGESFLVSLALALGLASLSANRVRVESLFIDEGFGSLDADTLGIAIDALDRLHAQGRKVGVISHVQELAGRIGTRILVERQSVGRSRVEVTR